jgi:hypothetical protein
LLRSYQQLADESRAFHRCPQDRVAIGNWLRAAERKNADAAVVQNSFDTRVEARYDVCFNLALVVANAQGWKPGSLEGHHVHTLEAACQAIDASEALFDRIDAIRQLRNQKYGGAERTQRDLEAAVRIGAEFNQLVANWLTRTHPALLPR